MAGGPLALGVGVHRLPLEAALRLVLLTDFGHRAGGCRTRSTLRFDAPGPRIC